MMPKTAEKGADSEVEITPEMVETMKAAILSALEENDPQCFIHLRDHMFSAAVDGQFDFRFVGPTGNRTATAV